MTEVLRASPSPEPPFASSSLTRSTSHTSLRLKTQPYRRPTTRFTSSSSSPTSYSSTKPATAQSLSAPPSTHASSSDSSSERSTSSTPPSSLSLQESYAVETEDEQDFGFPAYPSPPPPSQESSGGSSTPTPTKQVVSPPPSTPTPRQKRVAKRYSKGQSVGDDTALKVQPTRHVDYLSYNWTEEELHASWKHIVTKREELGNGWKRYENASWRTWAKSRSKLGTMSPEKIHWVKDHDLTWLYGPLLDGSTPSFGGASPIMASTRMLRMNSFGQKKSCLKKRSLSEIILQRSLSSSTLVRRAVDSIKSQHTPQHSASQSAMTDYFAAPKSISSSNPSNTPSELVSSPSTGTSGLQTPCEVQCGRRHIHFSDMVEQCIAIGDDDDDGDDEAEDADDEETSYCPAFTEEDDEDFSDDGIIMMKPENNKERKLSNTREPGSSTGHTPRGSISGSETPPTPGAQPKKTIAKLPSAALKYRGDTPEPPSAQNHSGTLLWAARPGTPALAPSASLETLKPSRPSSNFLLDEEDEYVPWQPRPGASAHAAASSNDVGFMVEDEDAEMRTRGLRRTASGMFMPYDDSADGDSECDLAVANGGIFGKVVDTVNTARDIAHVIWNVGWRG